MLYAACPEKKFLLGVGEWGTRPPLSKFFGSAPVLPWPFCPWVLMGTGDVLEKRDRMLVFTLK